MKKKYDLTKLKSVFSKQKPAENYNRAVSFGNTIKKSSITKQSSTESGLYEEINFETYEDLDDGNDVRSNVQSTIDEEERQSMSLNGDDSTGKPEDHEKYSKGSVGLYEYNIPGAESDTYFGPQMRPRRKVVTTVNHIKYEVVADKADCSLQKVERVSNNPNKARSSMIVSKPSMLSDSDSKPTPLLEETNPDHPNKKSSIPIIQVNDERFEYPVRTRKRTFTEESCNILSTSHLDVSMDRKSSFSFDHNLDKRNRKKSSREVTQQII